LRSKIVVVELGKIVPIKDDVRPDFGQRTVSSSSSSLLSIAEEIPWKSGMYDMRDLGYI
jgi:hypothetical protein